jgi:DNA helicase HerA-like ATPase
MLTKNIQMNTKIIFKLKITKREAPTVQLVEEWLAEHLISYLMALAKVRNPQI